MFFNGPMGKVLLLLLLLRLTRIVCFASTNHAPRCRSSSSPLLLQDDCYTLVPFADMMNHSCTGAS
jgi:hypothetical protein